MDRPPRYALLAALALLALLVIAVWPQPPPPPPPPPPEANGKFFAFDALTGRPASPTVVCDIYRHIDEEFLLIESVLNNHSIAVRYYRGDLLYLHIWSATDDRVCEQFKTFTVPGQNPFYNAEPFDIETQVVRQPSTWDVAPLADQTVHLGSFAEFTFTVSNTEDDTGYSRSYDFLEHIERCPLFVVAVNTTSVYAADFSWASFQRQDCMMYFMPLMDSDLTRDRLADGSRNPFGLLAIYLEAWFVRAGTYEIRYALVLDADMQLFIETGRWGTDARGISASAIITVQGD